LIVVVYVDDLVIIGNNNDLILRLKKQLDDSFDIIDLSTLYYFLGLQVLPLCDGFFISQYKYVIDLLTCFKMVDLNPCATPFLLNLMLLLGYLNLTRAFNAFPKQQHKEDH
jgi:hypothetical protein